MVPLGPRGPAVGLGAAARRRPTALHVDGFDPGPAARQPRPARDRRRPRVPRRPVGPPRPAAAARGAARQADPGRGGPRGRIVRRRGAADAALEAWGVTLDAETRHRIAAELGSDVPFFLAGGPALVEGRGERVTPLGWLRDAGGPTSRPVPDRPGLLLVTPGRRDLDAGGVRGVRRRCARRRRCRPPRVDAPRRRAAQGAARRRPAGASAACSPRANDLAPAAPGRRARPRAVQAGAAAAARAAGRPVGLRPDPLGALSFRRRGGGGRRARCARRSRTGGCRRRGAGRRSSPRPGSSPATSDTGRQR